MRSSSYRWGCDWALNAHRGDGAIAFCTLPSRWSARRSPHQSQDFKRKLKTKWYLKKIVIIKEGKREARGDRTKRCAKAEDSACLARQEERRRTLGSGRVGPGLRRPHLGPPPGPEHLLEAGAVREPREEPGRAEVPFASSCRAPGPSRRRRLELALPFPSPPLPAPFRKLSRPPPAALRGDTAEVPALLYACAAVQPP